MRVRSAWRLGGLLFLAACSTRPSPSPSPAPVAPSTRLLPGNVPRVIGRAVETGRLDPEKTLAGVSLLFRMSPAQKAASRALLADLQDPVSPRYHHWLKPAEVAASFGAASADVAAASAWLSAQGFTVHGPSPTGTRLLFSGTVGRLERAFGTEMHHYELSGEPHFALSVDPSVPANLSRFVLGLRGTHDFKLHPGAATRRPASPHYLEDAGASSGSLTLAPADFAAIYDLLPLYAAGITGSGQKIGVVGESDFNDADIQAFRKTFGLDTSLAPVRDLVPLSGASAVKDYNYFGETVLDLEWSGAVAKDATIYYVYTGNNPAYGAFDALVWAIEEGTYPVLTASYGGCEEDYTAIEDIYLESMGDAASMEGITVLNSSGDWGPASCDADTSATAAKYGLAPSWPASIPSFTAVGGTMFDWGDSIPEPTVTSSSSAGTPFATYWSCSFSGPASCSALGYVPETGWNEVSYDISSFNYFWGASGGGTSRLFAKPYWQIGTTPPGSMRLLPDVAVSAAWHQVGYVVSQSWTAMDGMHPRPQPEALSFTGGTSAASPSFAGIVALVNQALALKDPGAPVGLGNANPVLYALNASTTGTAAPAFHDITTGDNIVPCSAGSRDCPSSPPYQIGFTASAGYDLVTGLGSVDANNLVAAWTSLVPTSTKLAVTPSGTEEGATATLTATVSSTATSVALTGSVVFYVDTTDDGGLADLSLAATGTLTPSLSGGQEGGTATASVLIPPGLAGQANIVAFYGGDTHYLASWSVPAARVDASSTLAVSPTSATVNPNGLSTFTASGGVPPMQWEVLRDSTCNSKYVCSRIEPVSATMGMFQAGPGDGTATVAVIDSQGAEARAAITVAGPAVDGGTLPPPWDGSTPDARADSGASRDASVEAAPDGPSEADATDSSQSMEASPAPPPPPVEIGNESPDRQGCSCRAAGDQGDGGRSGGLAGLLLALGLAFARRAQVRTRARSQTTRGVITFGQ